MITKLDDCFNDYKDYDDSHHNNWSFLLFPIFIALEGVMKISLE